MRYLSAIGEGGAKMEVENMTTKTVWLARKMVECGAVEEMGQKEKRTNL